MIIFDRFLCCINLKSFGKCVGWAGMMICVFVAYAIFLVLTGRKSAVAQSNFYENPKFNHLSILFIVLLLIAALFHILLICGIKYVSQTKFYGVIKK
jgi:ABC-type Na+ efflux pump permease subunit